MMQPISSDAVIFALAIGGFIFCLLTLIAILSFFRQRRTYKEHLADTRIRPPKNLAEAIKNLPAAQPAPSASTKAPTKPQTKPIPEHQRLPVREAVPDQVVLQIDPPEGPSRDQRNVERLIAFLKNET